MITIDPIKTGGPERLECIGERQLPDARGTVSYSDRINYLSLSILAGMTLVVARILRPSPQGVGTHEQLGLPPCPFLYLTGIPCPSCGLTTSFAHAARLEFFAALITHPFGLVAFCLTVLSIPLSIYLTRRRIPWSRFIESSSRDVVIYTLIGLYALCWIYKIIAMKWLFAAP